MFYKKLIRPILFKFRPEFIHNVAIFFGELVARNNFIYKIIRKRLFVNNERLKVEFKGLTFENPIGLSAGFDKNAQATSFIQMLGFGFMELGSITYLPYKGNSKPRLRRLKKNNSLVVNFGLKGEGAKKVHGNLLKKKISIPVGISIAKSNLPGIINEKAIEDYVNTFKMFSDIGDYYTINISCPNTFDGTPFTDPVKLEKLLIRLNEVKNEIGVTKPIFLKINPDIKTSQIDRILQLIEQYNIDGIVVGNLFKNKRKALNNMKHPEEYDLNWNGGVSGKPLKDISTDRIRYIRNKVGDKLFIIGCGGVFNGDDAYEKIKAGANVVQLITGFIYNGPKSIYNINKRLLELKK